MVNSTPAAAPPARRNVINRRRRDRDDFTLCRARPVNFSARNRRKRGLHPGSGRPGGRQGAPGKPWTEYPAGGLPGEMPGVSKIHLLCRPLSIHRNGCSVPIPPASSAFTMKALLRLFSATRYYYLVVIRHCHGRFGRLDQSRRGARLAGLPVLLQAPLCAMDHRLDVRARARGTPGTPCRNGGANGGARRLAPPRGWWGNDLPDCECCRIAPL